MSRSDLLIDLNPDGRDLQHDTILKNIGLAGLNNDFAPSPGGGDRMFNCGGATLCVDQKLAGPFRDK